jgi:hypothetical protein
VALSPSIPTSFVPKAPETGSPRRFKRGGFNIFLAVASAALFVTIVLAIGTFLYSKLLTSESATKGQQVIAAQNSLNQDTLDQLLRLQSRLSASESIINQHVALTQFFTLLSSITVQDVNFTSVTITVNTDRSATLAMTGVAQDFNALANESNLFAAQKGIKNAVFSGFTLNKDNTVTFAIAGSLDPSLVKEGAPPSAAPTPAIVSVIPTAATSTPTSASTASTTKP